MKLKTIFTAIIILSFCNCSNKEKISSYQDFINEKKIYDRIIKSNDCKEKVQLFESIKTIDNKDRLKNHLKICGVNYTAIKMKDSPKVVRAFSDIMQDDQMAREQLAQFISQYNDRSHTKESVTKRELITDSILGKIDSLNFERFNELVDSIGEWPGAEYFERIPGSPKLEVIVGHMPEEFYMKYTLMAYKSATKGKEYWSKVKKLVGFSIKYIIRGEDYYSQPIDFYIPFRFTEFKTITKINEKSDLTKMEFGSISNIKFTRDIKYELFSSLDSLEDRKLLLENTRKVLIENGLNSNYILINTKKIDNKKYTLFYKFKE